jgi:hypothetical protein
LQVHTLDDWEWLPDPDAGYSVSGAYHILTRLNSTESYSHCELVWNNLVPLKVSAFAWRFMYNRLPTKYNLYDHGCLHRFYFVLSWLHRSGGCSPLIPEMSYFWCGLE